MWTLIPVAPNPDGAPYILPCGRLFTIGRSRADIVLAYGSVSRSQAVLTVGSLSAEESCDPSTRPSLSIEDVSRYGTFVSGIQIEKKTLYPLHEGDEIQFAVPEARFRVSFVQYLFCFSGMSGKQKRDVLEIVYDFGAHVLQEWNSETHNCTHLLMTMIQSTAKMMSAMLDSCPIVHPDWIQACLDRAKLNDPLPPYADFIPPVVAELSRTPVAAFLPSLRRKDILSNLTFFFPSFIPLEQAAPSEANKIVQGASGNALSVASLGELQSLWRSVVESKRNGFFIVVREINDEFRRSDFAKVFAGMGARVVGTAELFHSVVLIDRSVLGADVAPVQPVSHESPLTNASGRKRRELVDVSTFESPGQSPLAIASGLEAANAPVRSPPPQPSVRLNTSSTRAEIVRPSPDDVGRNHNFKKFHKQRLARLSDSTIASPGQERVIIECVQPWRAGTEAPPIVSQEASEPPFKRLRSDAENRYSDPPQLR